ncbi:MAG: DUF3078 domain-containing protein [Bacteroidota bacterium]
MTKHFFTLLLSMLLLTGLLKAQTIDTVKYWNFKGEGTLALSQVSLNNWAAGGEPSTGVNAMGNLFSAYKKGKFSWDNSLELAYGFLSQPKAVIKYKKTDDKIDFSSKAGIYAFKKWDYTILFGFKTQFSDGKNYPNDSTVISRFMAPGYFQLALGMNYKPTGYFSLFISPLGMRYTIVNDQKLADLGAFGVDPATTTKTGEIITHGKNTLWEFGASTKAAFQKEIAKNVTLGTKLELFSNYLKNPQNVVVNWEVLLSLKVNSFLTTTIATQLVYDDNIDILSKEGITLGPRTQFKEIIGVGLSHKFGK